MFRPLITLAIVLILNVSCIPSWAQETTTNLPPLIVTGLRGSVLPEHFSGNSSVIDEKKIRDSGARSLADLLESEGGLRITSTTGDSARGSISLRGFGENASSRTLVMVDGKPINRPDMSGVNLQEIPLARVARVEILRGSQTARFGDNAVGGVINIVTHQAQEKPATSTEAGVGTGGWWLGRLNHSVSQHGYQFNLDSEYNHDDGWRDNSMSESSTLAVGLTKRLNNRIELNSALSWAEQNGLFPGPLTTSQYHDDPRQSNYEGPFADQYGSKQSTLRTDLGAKIDSGVLGELNLTSSWMQRDLSWNMGPGSHSDNILETLTVSPTLRQSGQTWNTEQGIDLRHDQMDVTLFRDIARQRPKSDSELERTTLSAFASGDWEPWENWHFNSAVRSAWSTLDASSRDVRRPNDPNLNFDRSNDENNAALQLGLRWEPRIEHSAWFRYDRLYRLPSIDEIAAFQGFPLSQPFNDQLEAETGHNFELGSEWTPGPWQFKANAFAQFLDGEIIYDYIQNLNVNLANTRRLGGELEASYQATSWTASIRYSGVDAQFVNGPYKGEKVYLVPSHMLTSSVEYRPHTAVTIRLEHQYQGSCPEGNDFYNSQPHLPSFQIMNLMLRYRHNSSISCYIRINNLWDEQYSTLKYSGVWYPSAGRQIQLGIRHEF